MKKIICLLFALLVALFVSAQNRQQIRPDWLLEKPVAGNSTYEYVVEHGIGLTESAALEEAINRIHQYYTRRLGQGINSTDTGVTLQKETYTIPFRKVCEYTEKQKDGTYYVYILCQVALRGDVSPLFEEYTQCNSIRKYTDYLRKKNITATVASVFIPGVGQMIKGHYGSGIATLLGEASLIGGAVTSYYLAQNQLDIMQGYGVSPSSYNTAQKNYNICRTVSITCVSSAGVLYVYNLIRTFTMKQKYHDRNISLSPVIMPVEKGVTSGVTLTLKF
jgi:hypothetical protein